MKMENSTSAALSWWKNFRLKLVFEGVGVGLLSGITVTIYRLLLEEAEAVRGKVYAFINGRSLLYTILWFIVLITIGYVIGVLIKKEPMISGSGIPQVKGVLLRQIKYNWLRVVIGKVLGGALAVGAGLSLGREGPSIQIGAAMGQGFSRVLGRLKVEEKYLITCGAAAGLAAAFNAPLAGVIFVLEELHKNFSPLILTSAMAASITADFISKNIFGLKPVFDFELIEMLPLNYYGFLIILGVIIGIFGWAFNKVLIKTQDLYNQTGISKKFRPILPILAAGILGFVLPQVLGGGHGLVMSLSEGKFGLWFLMLLLGAKFLFTMVSFGSGVPGGIFLPLLAIGALIGGVYGHVLVSTLYINPQYINNFIILAMAGYFTAIVKAPITGAILVTEMVGSFSHLLSLTIVSITAYVITDILKSKPVYEILLERLLKNRGKSSFVGNEMDKVLLEVAVSLGSALDGKPVKDINWPLGCLLVALKRGEAEIIPKGNTRVYEGDYLVVLTNEDEAPGAKETLLKMACEQESQNERNRK